MTTKDFLALTPRQQHVLVLSMAVRNALEDFHAAHLTDVEMKELNQLIRHAVYDTVELLETMDGDPERRADFAYLVASVPDYWEIPGRDPGPTDHATG